MAVMTISEKGWVVIPKEFRQKYHLQPGDQVRLVDYGGGLAIVPLPADPVAALRGMLADGPSLTADLLADRQQAKAREDADD
jgi:AbrB family looped-hinge helix DNA binding protein